MKHHPTDPSIIQKRIALVYPAGRLPLTMAEQEKRIAVFEQRGFHVKTFATQQEAWDGCTGAPALERALMFAAALTNRKEPLLMAAKGGVGCTELIPFLEHILPPILPPKTLVGFSDISFLGTYLTLRYPNFRYIHGPHFFSPQLFETASSKWEEQNLLSLLQGHPQSLKMPLSCFQESPQKIQGLCFPLNLSLAESIATCRFLQFPQDTILFLEDCNELVYRLVRKCDSLINSGLLNNVKAIVLGEFSNCVHNSGEQASRAFLGELFHKKTGLPIFDFPVFGHGSSCFPLVTKSHITITKDTIEITETNALQNGRLTTDFPPLLYKPPKHKSRIHFTGIGGSGMAQVAGFFVSAGFQVSGSDNPIYPPMDKIIAQLGIQPEVGFQAHNLDAHQPDVVVMANVISRLSAGLAKNEELEAILSKNLPVFSFPSALRQYFLHDSCNIVVSGTHGKTTTSALIAFLLDSMGYQPSFLIGGSPLNFEAGYSLRSKDLYVLEGDEYDSAFFDKGPKFLHYEPKIALLNNIEFDHADIYENIECIEAEFKRLALLTIERQGIVVANIDDPRVLRIVNELQQPNHVIAFGKAQQTAPLYPLWSLKDFHYSTQGLSIQAITPDGQDITFQTALFGEHNALNCLAALAVLHAHTRVHTPAPQGAQHPVQTPDLTSALAAIPQFLGVRRRFQKLADTQGIVVFDDFAHHPTAIATTLAAFRAYGTQRHKDKESRLMVCFDPRNATMRRNILQQELIASFALADNVFLGKIPQDLRMDPKDVLDGRAVALQCGPKCRYFDDNNALFETLIKEIREGDIVIFMSSGAFDGLPARLAQKLQK